MKLVSFYLHLAISDVKRFYAIFKEGWQSGQMQRTVTPSGKPYIGSNPIPSTIRDKPVTIICITSYFVF